MEKQKTLYTLLSELGTGDFQKSPVPNSAKKLFPIQHVFLEYDCVVSVFVKLFFGCAVADIAPYMDVLTNLSTHGDEWLHDYGAAIPDVS